MELGAQIEQAEAPSKRLQQSFTQTEAKLTKQTAKLAELEARLKQAGADEVIVLGRTPGHDFRGEVKLDLANEILGAVTIVHDGTVRHEPTAQALAAHQG